MSIAAKISSTELREQLLARFGDAWLEARLIYSPGVSYDPGITDDANFLTFEIPFTNGYSRKILNYTSSDVSSYGDNGVGLATKATTFTHDGSVSTIEFSHVALVWSNGNVTALSAFPILYPDSGINGVYTNIPVDSTDGVGSGLTVDLTVTNAGAAVSDWSMVVNNPGYDYAGSEIVTGDDGDAIVITKATLAGIGAVANTATGDLSIRVSSATSQANAGDILSVAETSGTASLTAGNQAVFYWNLKQFGFYSTTTSP